MMLRPSRSPLRVGALVSLCLHLVLFAAVVLFVHGTPIHPVPKKRVILTLSLAAPAPPPPLTPPPAVPPPATPPPKLAALPKPLPRPVTSRATAKAIPAVPPLPSRPLPQPKPLARPKPLPQPAPKVAPRPAPVTPQPGVVGHHVSTNYKGLLEGKIRSNLRYPRMARRQGRQGTAVVRVLMKRDGTIKSINLVKSSGTGALDHEAEAVFQRIGQLPPLPHDFLPRASEFEFEVPITFRLVNGFGP